MTITGDLTSQFNWDAENEICATFILLLFGQTVSNLVKTGWGFAQNLQVLITLSGVMSDRPNHFTIFPEGGTTHHNVFFDEAGDNLTIKRQATHFVVCILVSTVNDQIPTARQTTSAEWCIAILFTCVSESKVLQHRLRPFATDRKPRERCAHICVILVELTITPQPVSHLARLSSRPPSPPKSPANTNSKRADRACGISRSAPDRPLHRGSGIRS